MNYKTDKESVLDKCSEDDFDIDYLLLPSIEKEQTTVVDWLTINSVNPSKIGCLHHVANIWTEKGFVCGCILQNALICTPHNGRTYITTDVSDLNGNSPIELGDGHVTTYKNYYAKR